MKFLEISEISNFKNFESTPSTDRERKDPPGPAFVKVVADVMGCSLLPNQRIDPLSFHLTALQPRALFRPVSDPRLFVSISSFPTWNLNHPLDSSRSNPIQCNSIPPGILLRQPIPEWTPIRTLHVPRHLESDYIHQWTILIFMMPPWATFNHS